jgi:tetratricopeptide (TPR) repeat protein
LQEEYDKAKNNLMTAIKLALRTGQKKELSMAYLELGELYSNLNKYEKAISYLIKSLNLKKSLGFKSGIAGTYRLIGKVYSDKGEPLKALSFLVKAKNIYEELGEKKGLADTYENIAEAYYSAYKKTSNQKFFNRAEENALKCFLISNEEGFLNNKMEIAKTLKKIYTEKGNYIEALKYADIYEQLRDTVYEANKQKAMMELQAKFEASEKEQKIKLQNEQLARMKAENERKRLQLYHERLLRIFLIVGGALLLIFLIFTFKAYKDKSKLNELLRLSGHGLIRGMAEI